MQLEDRKQENLARIKSMINTMKGNRKNKAYILKIFNEMLMDDDFALDLLNIKSPGDVVKKYAEYNSKRYSPQNNPICDYEKSLGLGSSCGRNIVTTPMQELGNRFREY